jgi:hypothetical protein
VVFYVEDPTGFFNLHWDGRTGELAVCNQNLFASVVREFTAKEIKAEAPYAISKYGKEYDTSATRLLFDRHLTPPYGCCRYASEQFPNKKLTGALYVPAQRA